jgi:phosphoribosylamine-glycine ligase
MMNIEGSPKRALTITALAKTRSGEWFPFKRGSPATKHEAHEYAKSVLGPKDGRPKVTSLIVKHNLLGTRITIITFSDGRKLISLPPVGISNERPEIGNICDDRGCIAPIQGISPELLNEINYTILQQTIEGLFEICKFPLQECSTNYVLTII